MLHDGCLIVHIHIGEGVCTALIAQKKRVATAVVACVLGSAGHLDQSAIGVLAAPCTDTLADDGALGIAPDVYHLGARIGLLVVVGDGHAVELSLGVIALKHTAGIFPGDGTARLHLCPGESAAGSTQLSALGDQVEHAALPVGITRIPVLHSAVLHLGILHDHYLHDGCMKLVLITHGSRTAFEIADIGIVVAHDERALKLSRATGIDTEIGAQFHGTAHALGDIHKGTVAEHG